MKRVVRYLPVILSICLMPGCKQSVTYNEREAQEFITSLEDQIIPAYTAMNKAYFQASVTGTDEDYSKSSDLEIRYSKILADSVKFGKVEGFRESEKIHDQLLKRELDVLYNSMIEYQIDTLKMEKLIKAQTDLEQKFSTFRAEINGKKVTDNEVEDILIASTDSKQLESAWLASKKIGSAVADDVKQLVLLRNEIARGLGYKNFHEMSLRINDQDPEEVQQVFDELDELTGAAFRSLKNEMDSVLAIRYHIRKDQLMPWHYQNRYFQEAPKIYDIDLDTYYKGKDILAIVKNYYAGIGLDVEDILSRSDLYEKEGKNQHAYCSSIDKSGDVRILANIRDDYYWTNTMLHELGHAVYDKYIDKDLPFILRDPAHIFTTEAIANFFGGLASNPKWMMKSLDLPEEEVKKIAHDVTNYSRLEKLVFSRWSQVMFRFEKSMYENPDQDLNTLWWDLVEKYQLLNRLENRDEPDWASKIHIAVSPCYYHNYLLGDLLAAQIDAYMAANIIGHKDPCYVGHPEIGEFLIEKIFKPGARYYWNDMIEKATGEKLTAKYYAEQYLD